MHISVKFAGKVREYSKQHASELELSSPTDVSGLLASIIERYPGIGRIRKFLFVSVNSNLATRDRELKDGDEVMLFFRPGGG